MFLDVKNFKKYLIYYPPIASTILGIAYYFIGPKLFDSSSRFHMYKISFVWWWEHASKLFGTGLSSYWVYGPLIQDENKWYKSDYFTFLHSDFLQVLFELGIVGMVLLFIMISHAVYVVIKRRRDYLLAPIAAYLVFMTFYFPLHSFVTAFVGAVLYRSAIAKDEHGD